MKSLRPIFVATVGAIFLALTCTACSGSFEIRPEGRFDNLTFSFYKLGEKQASAFSITRLLLQEEEAKDQWKNIWLIVGKHRLDRLTFGSAPSGLKVDTAAHPLSPKARYRVFAENRSEFGPDGTAGAIFRFGTNGEVIVEDPPR